MFRVSGITARDFSFIMGIDQVKLLDWVIGTRLLSEKQLDCIALLLGLETGDIEERPYYLSVGEDPQHLATVIKMTSIYQQGFDFKPTKMGRYQLRSGETTFIIKRSSGARNIITIEDLLMR